MFSADSEPATFVIPELIDDMQWRRVLDTDIGRVDLSDDPPPAGAEAGSTTSPDGDGGRGRVRDRRHDAATWFKAGDEITMQPRSVQLFRHLVTP